MTDDDSTRNAILAQVVRQIRATIDEDWLWDLAIGPTTRFNDDLEIESIEFLTITEAVQAHYGARIDIVGWLSDKTLQELIHLNVGDLVDRVATTLARR